MERFALDGYIVEDLLGFGGTGEVWRAREVATGETVALKRLRARGVAASERLRREAGLLQAVAGPHVIGVRRLLVDDDEAVMVMEYAAGGSLAAILSARGTLPSYELVTVIGPIATALAAAHSRDLVHGDLTPANILFTPDGRPLLADFGVARAMNRTAQPVEGTVDYLDPAVAAGGQPTPASDIFALGAVAFACLAGHSPWGSGSPEQLVERAAQGARPQVADVAPNAPERLVEAIEWMMSVDPADRPDAKTAGITILKSSAAAPVRLATSARPVQPPPTQVVRPARLRPEPVDELDDDEPGWSPWRRRIVITGAACAAMVGAIGVGISLAGGGHSGPATLRDVPTAATSHAVPVGAASPAKVTWFDVVANLDRARARAFDAADATALTQVYVPNATPYATDLATIRSMTDAGEHAQGFAATVTQVKPLSGTPTTERLQVVDRLSRYVLVDANGTVVDSGAARPATSFTMTLAKTNGTWRVAAIAPRR